MPTGTVRVRLRVGNSPKPRPSSPFPWLDVRGAGRSSPGDRYRAVIFGLNGDQDHRDPVVRVCGHPDVHIPARVCGVSVIADLGRPSYADAEVVVEAPG